MKAKFVVWIVGVMLLGSFMLARGMGESDSTTLVAAEGVTTQATNHEAVQEVRAEQKYDERVALYLAAVAENEKKAAQIPPKPRTTKVRGSRGQTTVSEPQSEPQPDSVDFWRALSNCESPTGVVGKHVGYFQFSWDTARKVGIDGTEDYETQKAAAQEWARRIHPNEATSSGWPRCWKRALAATT